MSRPELGGTYHRDALQSYVPLVYDKGNCKQKSPTFFPKFIVVLFLMLVCKRNHPKMRCQNIVSCMRSFKKNAFMMKKVTCKLVCGYIMPTPRHRSPFRYAKSKLQFYEVKIYMRSLPLFLSVSNEFQIHVIFCMISLGIEKKLVKAFLELKKDNSYLSYFVN